VAGLRFVAAPWVGELMKGATAEQAHARLAVSDGGCDREGEDSAGKLVHGSSVGRHRTEVIEPVADQKLGVVGAVEQSGDRCGWVLAVGVDDEDRLGLRQLREDLGEACADRLALAPVDRKAQQLGPCLA
jgi:hypothetical protein